MSDEVPLGRLSQIFDTLTNLQQQQSLQVQATTTADQRRRSASSSPSPSASASASSSGRATPSAGAHALYYAQSHQSHYFLRPQDGSGVGFLHTFPSHLYHHQQQQHQPQHQQHLLNQQLLQQPPSLPSQLPGRSSGSQSLHGSPLLVKRATSFSGQIPLVQGRLSSTTSTPNSPRLMPRRVPRPPPIPAKQGSKQAEAPQPPVNPVNPVNPVLAALDAPDAPWPHFSALTEHLDVHQVNNYGQALPEINWQERCLELQLELHRSKNQAGRIRDMLREKMSKHGYPSM
ncbi:GL14425 [Drosophila persimilis]|uniref:GL14425 n=1 Tax=Drosophila persimilis TaxID=7234 RepID=B4GTU7_DROPE|nr:GL14425 [Drosophila persimilis]